MHCKALVITDPLFHPKICLKLMASVTNVCVNPLDFPLVSLALLSPVWSAAVSMSVNHSSSLVELCSLKTAISCCSEVIRFWLLLCGTQGVCVLPYHFTEGFSRCGWRWWMECDWEILKFTCSMWSKVSAGCPSPASTHWCTSHLSPSWMLLIYHDCCYIGSSGMTFCLWCS